jgi:hypothetical protein
LPQVIPSGEDCQNNRAVPYSLEDDLAILRAVCACYGCEFCGNIPWSFWETFKRVTGSSRSISSLYHHWKGPMQNKYVRFLESRKFYECMRWIEATLW